jgi:predicted small lipoprotein YifL
LLLIRRTIALAASFAVALALAACGRNGPLEPPPGPATTPVPSALAYPQVSPQARQADTPLPGVAEDAAAQKTGFDAQGNPVATSGQKRPFFLDPILQ